MNMNAAQRRIHQTALRLFAEKDAGTVSVSELAEAARVARGTIYNNLGSIDALFMQVANRLCSELNEQIALATANEPDPAVRLAAGIRHYFERAHHEPDLARFILRHATTHTALAELWNGPPMRDLQAGQESARFRVRADQLPSALSMIVGSVLGGLQLLLDGRGTWDRIASDIAEFALRGLGLPTLQARRIAGRRMKSNP